MGDSSSGSSSILTTCLAAAALGTGLMAGWVMSGASGGSKEKKSSEKDGKTKKPGDKEGDAKDEDEDAVNYMEEATKLEDPKAFSTYFKEKDPRVFFDYQQLNQRSGTLSEYEANPLLFF